MSSKQISEIPVYTISNAAKLLEISVHTLRMYEREGLIIPFKKESSQRLYSDKDLERIKCIRNSINQDKIGIEGIRRMLSMIPCWAITKCSKSKRKNCQAFQGYSKPCWMFEREGQSRQCGNCRDCEVYSAFGDCRSIKEKLKVLLAE